MLSALSAERAEYLVVGGYAVSVHSEPHYTKDLDIWIRPTRTNATRVLRALKRFGAPQFGLKASELSRPGLIVQIGIEPMRIDLLTEVLGIDFKKAAGRAGVVEVGGVGVPVISLEDLIENKR